ncbi:MAG TPA: type II toxin-antitoxin system VapC family toxin [Rhizomicrobium sp.]
MTIYLDTSVVVSFFVADSLSARSDAFLRGVRSPLVLADFAAAEFVSAIGRHRRTGVLTLADALLAISNFDRWRIAGTVAAETHSADVQAADAMLRRLDLTLRTPDAVNLAIAQRLGAELATFDQRMADCARALAIPAVVL